MSSLKIKQIKPGSLDLQTTIWRYLTFSKLESLVVKRALWFSKLEILEDKFEGTYPKLTREEEEDKNREIEGWFPDEDRKKQVRRFVADNEESGRELTVVSCWHISESENQRMWNEYVGDLKGVVIKSTVQNLLNSLTITHQNWFVGKVDYVDLSTHKMSPYEGAQSFLRAFLKNLNFSWENEMRVATENWVSYGCLNPDGSPPNEKQKSGFVYAQNRPGIMVCVDLKLLINEIRSAPKASNQNYKKIEDLLKEHGVKKLVTRSEL